MRAACLFRAAILALGAIAFCPIASASAESPAALCAAAGTDDTLRPVPATMARAVNDLFGTRMPPEVVAAVTVFRCAGGRVLVCTEGANLPCGKANQSRVPGAGLLAWCREHPESDFVPAFAAGHDTVYAWRCAGGTPQAGKQVLDVDKRGFVARFWRKLP